jgi:hypothetical protein
MTTPSAAKLRGRIAEAGLRIYEVSSAWGRHPATLGRILNEHAPLSQETAAQIEAAVQRLEQERCTK